MKIHLKLDPAKTPRNVLRMLHRKMIIGRSKKTIEQMVCISKAESLIVIELEYKNRD